MSIKELIFGKQVKNSNTLRNKKAPDSTEGLLPISDIRHGMVITDDGRFVKILEVLPVNFYLKSPAEQQNIIYYFASWLKIAPMSIQILTVTQKADICGYVQRLQALQNSERNEMCRSMIEDNIEEVEYLAEQEAVTRRFFISFRYEPDMKLRDQTIEAIADRLDEEAETARRYLEQCGIEVVQPKYTDLAACDILYGLIQKNTSAKHALPESVFSMCGLVHGVEEVDYGGDEH